MCIGGGGDDKDKNKKGKDKKVTTNDQGAGTALMGLMDAATAAKTGKKVNKDSPAIGMTYGASPVGRNSNLPSGTILAMDNGGGGGGGGGPDDLGNPSDSSYYGTGWTADTFSAAGQQAAADWLAAQPAVAAPAVAAPAVTDPLASTSAPVVTETPRTSTTYGPLGTAYSSMQPLLASGKGSGRIYR